MNVMPHDVVFFTEKVNCDAGRFCLAHGIAGVVKSIQPTAILVDAGLGYIIYASRDDVVLAPPGTVAKRDKHGNAPNPALIPLDDGGI